MNGPAHDESNWDSLLSELGVDPAPESLRPAPSVPAAPAKSTTPHRESAPKWKVETPEPPFGALEPERPSEVQKSPEFANGSDEEIDPELDDTVIDEIPDLFGDPAPLGTGESVATDEAKDGEDGGRKRRRRRRRKKPGEPAANAAAAVDEDTTEDSLGDELPSLVKEEGPVEIITEAGVELDDEEPEEIIPPTAVVEDEDESTEPLPEWKVVAWTDLIATLYRPQDR